MGENGVWLSYAASQTPKGTEKGAQIAVLVKPPSNVLLPKARLLVEEAIESLHLDRGVERKFAVGEV